MIKGSDVDVLVDLENGSRGWGTIALDGETDEEKERSN